MKNNFLSLLEELARNNSKVNPNAKKQLEYDALLRPLQLHYMLELNRFPKGKLLDVGCAYGTQSVAFSELGFDVEVIDAMPELSTKKWFSKRNKPIQFSKCNVEKDELPEGKYDYIVFSEVIEHLNYNPYSTLVKLFKALKPGGIILMSTPMKEMREHLEACTGRYCAYAHYRDIPEAWNGYTFLDAHNYLYAQYELMQLFHEVGFLVHECFPVYRGRHHYLIASRPHEAKKVTPRSTDPVASPPDPQIPTSPA